jgi:hypothetical protein
MAFIVVEAAKNSGKNLSRSAVEEARARLVNLKEIHSTLCTHFITSVIIEAAPPTKNSNFFCCPVTKLQKVSMNANNFSSLHIQAIYFLHMLLRNGT